MATADTGCVNTRDVCCRLVILDLPYHCWQQDDQVGKLQGIFSALLHLRNDLVLPGIGSRDGERHKKESMKTHPLTKPLIAAFLLIFVDGYVLSQGVLISIVAVWQVVAGLANVARSKTPETREIVLARMGVFVIAAVAVFSFNALNNKIAQSRAEQLVTAIKAYRQAENQYPNELKDLVPKYIPMVPLAKYSMMYNEFHYSGKYHFLLYVSFPPFTRPSYFFDRNEWATVD